MQWFFLVSCFLFVVSSQPVLGVDGKGKAPLIEAGAWQEEFSSESENSSLDNVFGTDDRTPMESPDYPWSAIGKVRFDGGWCTGTLVADDLVLTNRHCVRKEEDLHTNIEFLPNYKNGESVHSSYADFVWNGESNGSAEDWAIIRLNSPLGENYGYLGWKKVDFSRDAVMEALAGKLILGGYSGDYHQGDTAGVHIGCTFQGFYSPSDLLLHDCDMTGGASGSGIFAKFKDGFQILAVNFAHISKDFVPGTDYSHEKANLAFPVARVTELVGRLQRSREGKSDVTQVHLCNRAERGTLYAALAYADKTRGWFPVDEGKCREVPLSEGYAGDVFVYAESRQGSVTWGAGDKVACVHRSGPFEYESAVDCRGEKKLVTFGKAFAVKANQVNSYYFRP